MAITQAVCNTFKTELLTGTHNFTASTGNTFRIALITSAATASKSTTNYSDISANEVADSGSYVHQTASQNLVSATPTLSGDTAVCDFTTDIAWTTATITARGALIYNNTASNKACVVLDFTTDKTSTNGTFTVVFPTADASNAIIRIA